jgi:hypothetical protein
VVEFRIGPSVSNFDLVFSFSGGGLTYAQGLCTTLSGVMTSRVAAALNGSAVSRWVIFRGAGCNSLTTALVTPFERFAIR